MIPSPALLLSTTHRIDNHLKNMNQKESYIKPDYVFSELKMQIDHSIENGHMMSESEISDRVVTIVARRLNAIITSQDRFLNDVNTFQRPENDGIPNQASATYAHVPPRGEFMKKERRNDLSLPERFIDLK